MDNYTLGGTESSLSVLVLGAHCDDIEIGCGATLARLSSSRPSLRVLWVTFSADVEREAETRNAAKRILQATQDNTIRVERFRESYFPECFGALKDCFETLKAFKPSLVFTHARNDLHQDHRVINELTWNAFRDHRILEYEIPKFDGDLGVPNVYVPLTRSELDAKCAMLSDSFPSQHLRRWFTRETFEALARLRGIECNAPAGYAEAFYGRKLILGV